MTSSAYDQQCDSHDAFSRLCLQNSFNGAQSIWLQFVYTLQPGNACIETYAINSMMTLA